MNAPEIGWLEAAARKGRIERAPFLRWVNRWIRIPLSLSAQRDRFFLKHIPKDVEFQWILDLGCGSGRRYLNERGAVMGVDLNRELLAEASKIYATTALEDIVTMRWSCGQYDVVLSSDVIGHIEAERKTDLFNQIHRCTAPGGITIHFIEVTPKAFWPALLKYLSPSLFKEMFIDRVGHVGLESVDQVLHRLNIRGFKIIEVQRTPNFFAEVGVLSASMGDARVMAILPGWARFLVKMDAVLARNIWVREFLNILLRPVAWIESLYTDKNKTTAIMVAARRGEC